MAAGYDGSIRIKALMNHSQFDRGIRSMGGSLKTLESTLMKLAGAVGLAFGVAAIVNFGKESVKAASELSNAWMGLQSIVEGQGRSFSRAKSFVEDYISDGLVPLTDAVTAYKNLAARGYSDEQIQKTMTALKDAAAFGRQSTYTLGEAVKTAAEGLKNENSILVDNAGVTKNVAKMWDEYAKSIGTTANKLTQEQKIQAEVNGILEETRFQTGDAAKLVNTYSGQISMLGFNFQQLKVQVGNALMPIVQAVLPGINAIISALLKLAKVFAQVTALLFGKPNPGTAGQVSANEEIASSGLAAADATDKLADATAGAGSASKKAAKDMKGVLAGFDELNVLADKASGSVDSAAGGISAGEIEAVVPELDLDGGAVEEIGESFKSLGEIFRDTLDEMLSGIPRLKEAFLGFASNFNEFNQKLYDAFTFDGILERVQRLGRELAGAFNGLVNAIDWQLWGQQLGAGLNLGLQFLTEFVYSFDWTGLGQKLADLFNGLVYEVDWYDFGRLLWAQFKTGLETFAGFFTNLDMPALAKAAGNIIMGFFDEMKNTIAKIDWAEIGRQVARFLSEIDWMGILDSVWGALKEAVMAGFDFLAGVVEEGSPGLLAAVSIIAAALGVKFATDVVPKIINVGNAFGSFFRKIKDISVLLKYEMANLSGAINTVFGPGSTLAGIAMVVGGAVLAFTNFFSMLRDGFSWANEALMLLGIALTAVGAVILGAPAMVAGVIAGIVAVVATAAVLISENWESIKAAAVNAWEAIKEAWAAAGEWFDTNVIQPVTEFFTALWESVTTTASNAWQAIQEIWSGVSGWFSENIIEPVKTFFSELWAAVKSLASEAWEAIKTVWSIVADWFRASVVDTIKQIFTEMWNGVKEAGSSAWESIQSAWQNASKWFEDHVTAPLGSAFEKVVGTVKNAINGMIGAVEGMVNSVVKAVNWLIDQLNKIRFDVPDWVPGVGGRSFGFNIQRVSEVTLPRLANGAVIPPNQQFAAILGDQRSGTNIEAPVAEIEKAVARGIQMAGGYANGNRDITIILQMDKREFGRAVYTANNEETQRVGVRLTGVKA